MLTGIRFIITTHSSKEREELKQFISSKKPTASAIESGEGLQYIAISIGDVWFVSSVNEQTAKSSRYLSFSSTQEFIRFFKAKNLHTKKGELEYDK